MRIRDEEGGGWKGAGAGGGGGGGGGGGVRVGSGRVLIKKNRGQGKGASFQPFVVKVYVNGIFVVSCLYQKQKIQKHSYYLLGHRHTICKFSG